MWPERDCDDHCHTMRMERSYTAATSDVWGVQLLHAAMAHSSESSY
jgi:hypothetical protein